jgi:hypothetical protein
MQHRPELGRGSNNGLLPDSDCRRETRESGPNKPLDGTTIDRAYFLKPKGTTFQKLMGYKIFGYERPKFLHLSDIVVVGQ